VGFQPKSAKPGETASPASAHRETATSIRLLEAGRAVFDRRGWNAATVDDIIREAGVSRGTFYLYFQNKRDIFEALIKRVIDELYERAAPTHTDLDIFSRLELGNRAFLDVWERHGDLMRNMLQLAAIDPHFTAINTALRRRFIERTRHAIASHREEGITHDIDPAIAANAMGSMVESVADRHFTYHEPVGLQRDVRTLSYELSALWYRAVYNNLAPPVPPMDEYLAREHPDAGSVAKPVEP
jgi:AcrR family transcriptional regulator